jgi:hypothetical protein
MNIIHDFNEYLLNETLKTYDINITADKVRNEINLQRINANVNANVNDNKINIKMNDVMYNHAFGLCLDVINVMMINWFGWFPSQMNMINWLNQENIKMYNREILIEKYQDLKSVEITYEAKYDLESKIPHKLYHLSIQEFESKILKLGLSPKSGNKLTKHFDRIYVCNNIDDCKKLIPRMKLLFNEKKFNNRKLKLNDKWVIYEINTNLPNKPKKFELKLFKDPNYPFGYYIIDNINPQNIKIIDRE